MTVAAPTRPQKSTIVRLFVVPPQVRALFRLLEHTAPALGARWRIVLWPTLSAVRPLLPPCATGCPWIGWCCSRHSPALGRSPTNSLQHSGSVTGPTDA